MRKGARNEAILAGRETYYNGKPCSKGHIDFRYTKNSGCVVCVKELAVAHNKKKLKKISELRDLLNIHTCEIFLYVTEADYQNILNIAQNFISEHDDHLGKHPVNIKEFLKKQVSPGVFQIRVRVPYDKVNDMRNIAKLMLDMSLGAIKPPDPIPIPDTYNRSTLTEDYSKI